MTWLLEASVLGTQLEKPADSDRLAGLLKQARELLGNAPDPTTAAIAQHFKAVILQANGRSSEASDAFAAAGNAWSQLGDRNRALAARVGQVEELRSIDAHQAVLNLTPDIASLSETPTYFSTRLENPRCLSLRALGRVQEAQACSEWVMASYRTLGEDAEFVVAAQNYAALLRDLGDLQAAEDLGLRSLKMVTGSDAPMLRGRLRLMLADISLRRGQIAQSFGHAKQALDEFEHAMGGAVRWQANALLVIANLYSQLDANDEAYAALGEAVKRLAPLGAPNRMALAMNVFADIETNTGHLESSLLWRRTAEQTYMELKMIPYVQATRAVRLQQQVQLGDFTNVRQAIAQGADSYPLDSGLSLLLEGQFALHEGRMEDALRAIRQLASVPLSLRSQLRAALLEADYWNLAGNRNTALQSLLMKTQEMKALALRAGSPTLRYTLERQVVVLRRFALTLLLLGNSSPVNAQTAAAVWAWLALDINAISTADTDARPTTATEQFDRAIAAELSAWTRSSIATESAVNRELLAVMAQSNKPQLDVDERLRTMSLEQVQGSLDADSAMLVYASTSIGGALLWITHTQSTLAKITSPEQLRERGIALRDLLRTPDSSVVEVQAAAQRLSTQLFEAVSTDVPPKHLYVLAEEPLNSVPWVALTWPGASGPLLDTTTIKLVRLDAGGEATGGSLPTTLQVIIAAQQGDNASLPKLAGAEGEGAAVGGAITSSSIQMEIPTANRAVLISALRVPGAWVHIAAHGIAQPHRIGYSGIWLEPQGAEKTPEFLSWIDILDSGVNADLVVLNACQLGDSGSAVNGNLSFADAVSRAGAKHVVAALWPVSDSAAALWVPEFYSTITADPQHDAANALRAAQLRLRESRAFRHPFFWAGMQTINRMSIGSKALH